MPKSIPEPDQNMVTSKAKLEPVRRKWLSSARPIACATRFVSMTINRGGKGVAGYSSTTLILSPPSEAVSALTLSASSIASASGRAISMPRYLNIDCSLLAGYSVYLATAKPIKVWSVTSDFWSMIVCPTISLARVRKRSRTVSSVNHSYSNDTASFIITPFMLLAEESHGVSVVPSSG